MSSQMCRGKSVCFTFAVILIAILQQTFAQSSLSYVRVGCYKDRVGLMRSMTLLASYRNPPHKTLDWNDLKTSVVDQCALEAKKTNSPFFGIQYYGECWGGPGQYNRHGKSANCARIGGAYVGKGFANYVYMLTGDECTTYTTLSDFTRSRSYNDNINRCDHWSRDWPTEGAWYRFDGAAGKAMANSCVGANHCGTEKTGWFNGNLPVVADGISSGAVCFNDKHNNCCSKKLDTIRVRRCEGFYVYHLPSTHGCNEAYCGDGSL
ncbi:hypothetical protein OS493_031648 [Desmophyllum pertusum]|uniref:UMOD/GP2/OIT3-like D8C domain-containing protein n=1 Tax=Desmophyllum pertusum TaxID=174260 RepID=A0A9W9Y8K2_9CNID|nr:hypothetical protein OS493_031648 [Desmophyllum pertusum]